MVQARGHNPSILHPSFLKNQKLVPESWEVDQFVCTMPFSSVRYKNHYTFQVTEERLQIEWKHVGQSLRDSKVADMAKEYITVLKYVNYGAIGLNISAFFPKEEPETFLINRFLAVGPSNQPPYVLAACKIVFTYPLPPSVSLNVELAPGALEGSSGIVVQLNFHLEGEQSMLPVAFLDTYPERCHYFEEYLNAIFR